MTTTPTDTPSSGKSSAAALGIDVRPMSGHTGAEILGVDLAQPHTRAGRGDPRHAPEVEGRVLPRPGPHAGAAHRVRSRVRRRHARAPHPPRADPRLPGDPAARQRRLREPRRPADREPLALRRHLRGEPADGVDPPRRGRASLRRRHAVHQHSRSRTSSCRPRSATSSTACTRCTTTSSPSRAAR